MNNSKFTTSKWIGYGLLYGSILLSFVFFIVVMAIGFKVPSATSPTNGTLGLWELKVEEIILNTDILRFTSTMSDTGVACIVFMVINLGLLIAGFVVHKKASCTTNKFIKIATISSFIIFAIASILALVAKVNVDLDLEKISTGPTIINMSFWIKLETNISTGFVKYEYTVAAIPVVALLSLSIVLPTIYTILGLIKIPYNK